MQIQTLRTPGLGDTTYVLSHNGVAIVVDPQRDIDRFTDAARSLDGEIRLVLETHVHNDYVSGGRALAAETRARLLLPAGAGVAFDHVPAFHMEDVRVDGQLTIRPIHTPGHTPEHVSYLVLVDGEPTALFSGGSLLVGAAGRTDLLGQLRARQLARLQYASVHRLIALPGDVGLFPTHGSGSFCSASAAGESTSTIAAERTSNPILNLPDPEAFAENQLARLQPYPRYYANMAALNVVGQPRIPDTSLRELSTEDARDLGADTWLIDARPRQQFASGHLPGAIGIELDDDFATWVGWLVPFETPVALVLNADQDLDQARVQLGRIGFENVRGVVRDLQISPSESWSLRSFRTVDVDTFLNAVVHGQTGPILDVRSRAEWRAGHLPGSIHCYLPDLTDGLPEQLPADGDVWVVCASGYRASIAAGLLERAGRQPVVLTPGGIPDLLQHLSAQRGRAAA